MREEQGERNVGSLRLCNLLKFYVTLVCIHNYQLTRVDLIRLI